MTDGLSVTANGLDLRRLRFGSCQQLIGGLGKQQAKLSIQYSQAFDFVGARMAYCCNLLFELGRNSVLVGRKNRHAITATTHQSAIDSIHTSAGH